MAANVAFLKLSPSMSIPNWSKIVSKKGSLEDQKSILLFRRSSGVPWPRFGSLVARLWPHVAAINAHFLPYLKLLVVVASNSNEKLDAYFNADSLRGDFNFKRNFLQAWCGILASGNLD